MKRHLKRLVTLIGILCLTNTIFAQSEVESAVSDFFEFVVVEEPVVPVEAEVEAEVVEETVEVVSNAEESAVVETIAEKTEEPAAEAVVETEEESVDDTAIVASEEVPAVNTNVAPAEKPAINTTEAPVEEPVSDTNTPTVETIVETKKEPVANTNVNVAAVSNETPATSAKTTETSEAYEESDEVEDIEEAPVDDKAPSRSVTIKKKQYLDVTYPGEGWLFMGDENNSKALSFKGREQKGNTTLMKFYSDRAGEALLHFCKQDILTDTYIHDYLLVKIEKLSGNKQHIQAPEYIPAPAVTDEDDSDYYSAEEQGQEYGTEQTEQTEPIESPEPVVESAVTENEEESEEIIFGEDNSLADEPDVVFSFGDGIDFFGSDDDDYYQQLIDEANDAFFSGRGQEAVDKAQIVIDDGSYFSDEALYIQAQVYETDTALLDVNKAYGLYKMIVDYYPESAMWSKASKRVTYLERYYYSIR